MKLWRLPLVIMVSCIAGCATTERTIFALLADQFRDVAVLGLAPIQQEGRTAQQHRSSKWASATKITIVKPPKPEPAAARVPEPILPSWSKPPSRPLRTLTNTLPPSVLFKRLSESVYTVAVTGYAAQPDSQGSAVAISIREAVTACHVVAHGRAITLTNGSAKLGAKVIGADLATDRCLLRADGDLQPVPGFREYDNLLVGETVYTIGSPKGWVNTLGSGIVSGLRRTDDEMEYIQISAPVSPGSSGGGLFDDRGNLIGIVIFTIKDSQNLNFAIASSQFWK